MLDTEKLTAKEVKEAAYHFGADIVSIGSIDRWKDIPANQNPKSIMPKAKSVICIGFRIHRGLLRGAEEGTYFSAYTLAGFNDLNKIIAPMAQRQMASFIEDWGYEAVPIMYYSHNLGGRHNMTTGGAETEEVLPDVFIDFRLAGVLCGAGEIGHSRLLLTPEFGPAQRIYFIVTEAELEADPIITGICDNCMECVRQCPAKALNYKCNDNIELENVASIKRSKLNAKKCSLAHVNGATSKFAPDEVKAYVQNIFDGTDDLTADGKPFPTDEEIKANVIDKVDYVGNAKAMFHSPAALCGDGCVRACLAHLDERGKLSKKFHRRFRES